MKRLVLLTLLCIFTPVLSFAQKITNFGGKDPVKSDGYTGALYKVESYEHATHVTVELKPTEPKSFLHYYSSVNTIIDCGYGVELHIAGFLREGIVDTAPFYNRWGWQNPKVGQSYYYTMVFSGRIGESALN